MLIKFYEEALSELHKQQKFLFAIVYCIMQLIQTPPPRNATADYKNGNWMPMGFPQMAFKDSDPSFKKISHMIPKVERGASRQ